MFGHFVNKVRGIRSENYKRKQKIIMELHVRSGELDLGPPFQGAVDHMRARINRVAKLKSPSSASVAELQSEFKTFESSLLAAKAKSDESKQNEEKAKQREKEMQETERKNEEKRNQIEAIKGRLNLQLHFMDELIREFAIAEIVHLREFHNGKHIERDIFDQHSKPERIAYSIGKLDDLIKEFLMEFLPMERAYLTILKSIDQIRLPEAEEIEKRKIEGFGQTFLPGLAKIKLLAKKIESYHKLRKELSRADSYHTRDQALFTPIDAEDLEGDHLVLGTDGKYYTEKYFKFPPDMSSKLKVRTTQSKVTPCQEMKAIYDTYKQRRIQILKRIEDLRKCPDLKACDQATLQIQMLIDEHKKFEWEQLDHYAGHQSFARHEYLETRRQLAEKHFLDITKQKHLEYWATSIKQGATYGGFVAVQYDAGLLTPNIINYTIPKIIYDRMKVISHTDFIDADSLIQALNALFIKGAKPGRYSFVAQMAEEGQQRVLEMKAALSQPFVKPRVR